MSQQTEITRASTDSSMADQIQANERFTGVGVNVVVISLAIVALLPMLFSTHFWALPTWQIALTFLLWLIYIVNGTGGMMLHERFIHLSLAPYLYFGLQMAVMAGMLVFSRDSGSGAVWILILPIAAQSLSQSRLFTAVISLSLLGSSGLPIFPIKRSWTQLLICFQLGRP